MGMHFHAFVKALSNENRKIPKPGADDLILDFGCGPATSLFGFERAAVGRPLAATTFVGIERSQSMRNLAEVAVRTLDLGHFALEATAEQGAMSCAELGSGRANRLFLVFSYFFGQNLEYEIIEEVARAASGTISRMRPRQVVSVYTNIDIECAAWMPNGDIHYWYRAFIGRMDWKPQIDEMTYTYPVPSDLELDPNHTASGSLTYDVQAHTVSAQ